MPLLRQRKKTLCKKGHLRRQHRQLPRTGPKQSAFDADEIADIEQLVQLEIALRQLILLRVNLKLAFAIRQRQESGFPEWTIRQYPSRNPNLLLVVLQILSRFVRILFDYVRQRVR